MSCVETGDGWTLYMEERAPETGGDGPVLLLSHGMMVNRKSLDRPPGRGMASWFRERGFHVYLLDLRGHGASGPKAAEGADWTYDDVVFHDLPAAMRAVARRHPDRPRFFLGHSLSAHAGAASLGLFPDLPVDGAVLVGPVVWSRRQEPSAVWWFYKKTLLRVWGHVTRRLGRTPARLLRIGTEDEPPSYVAQFADWAREDRWVSRQDAPGAAESPTGRVDYLAALGRIEVPVLVLNARGDRWISRTPCVQRFADAMERSAVTFLELGRRELGTKREPGHMSLVTDPECHRAWQRAAEWMEATS